MSDELQPENLQRILGRAIRAPSGDNCQPWVFNWDGARLEIHLDLERARHEMDVELTATYLAVGGLLETIRITASEVGMKVSVLPRPQAQGWVIEFGSDKVGVDPLARFIEQRFCDRRPFKKASLTDSMKASLMQEAGRFSNCTLAFADPSNPELADYISQTETLPWMLPDIHRDLMRWIRWSNAEAQVSRDGMPWQTLGLNYLESRVLKCARWWPLQRTLNALFFLNNVESVVHKNIRSSGALFCIATKGTGVEALVEIGQLAQRLWLRLCEWGWSAQPYTISSLSCYWKSALGSLGPFEKLPIDTVLQSGRKVLSQAFSLSTEELPIWVFRVGLAFPRKSGNQTLRRPLQDVLTVASSSEYTHSDKRTSLGP